MTGGTELARYVEHAATVYAPATLARRRHLAMLANLEGGDSETTRRYVLVDDARLRSATERVSALTNGVPA